MTWLIANKLVNIFFVVSLINAELILINLFECNIIVVNCFTKQAPKFFSPEFCVRGINDGFKSQQWQVLLTGSPSKYYWQGTNQINQGPTNKQNKKQHQQKTNKRKVAQASRSEGPFAFLFLKSFLKFIFCLPKWKFYATEGPPP